MPLYQFFVGLTCILIGLVLYNHALYMLDYRASDFVPGMELKYQIAGVILILFGLVATVFTYKRVIIVEKDLIILNLINTQLIFLVTSSTGYLLYETYFKYIWLFIILLNYVFVIIQNNVNIKFFPYFKYIIPLIYSSYILIKDAYDYFIYNYEANDLIAINYLIKPAFIILSLFIIFQVVFIYIEPKLEKNKGIIFTLLNYFITLTFIFLGMYYFQVAERTLHLSGTYRHGMEIKYQLTSYGLIGIGLISFVIIKNNNKLLALTLFNILYMIIAARYMRLGNHTNAWTITLLLYLVAVGIQYKVKSKRFIYLKYLIPMIWPVYIFVKYNNSVDLTKPIYLIYLLMFIIQWFFIYLELQIQKNKGQILPLLMFLTSIACILLGIYYQKFSYYQEFFTIYKNASDTLLITGRTLLLIAILLQLVNIYQSKRSLGNGKDEL